MSEIANIEGASESEKPVQNEVKFPPFPDPTENDFDEDIPEEERTYYKTKFKDLNDIKQHRLHCSACDRHLGCSARNERMRMHPMLRTLVCHSCHTFYNSGEFEKGDDGSELYCRWCGQGGQVYCCSDCPHVFCAKCIKRNLGNTKIKEIENADDWKCFKCNPECLMDLRATCWAVLRFCDLRNKMTYLAEDPELKSALQKECALDPSECCKHKISKRNQKISDTFKKKEIKKETDKQTANVVSKLPPTIQVKKFASINTDDSPKVEKKAQKRPASPKLKTLLVKNSTSVPPKILTPVVGMPPAAKKIRFPTINSPVRFPNLSKAMTYTRIRPKITSQLSIPVMNSSFNGFSSNVFHCNPINDNINLSLESLTQGLDMAAVAAMSTNNAQDDDVVCTPDFPMEPLCEVTEDNDDDVECITPGPVAAPKVVVPPPPLVPRTVPNVSDISSDNIIQMTNNDVTVNEATGGLKFRVDPQTLSSNKMYRLPDGRIFAINANPNMPGGYSATIVAVTDSSKGVPKGATFAAKLSSVSTSTPTSKNDRNQVTRFINPVKRSKPKPVKAKSSKKPSDTSPRECDLTVPVEWYKYNLIDAVDALEYSLSRLRKLKKEATSVFLRTRTINEMRYLHRTLERLLNTSSNRFSEIRENLNKGLKKYVQKKSGDAVTTDDDDDDDVEILPDVEEDPIFIDENSVDSNANGSETQEVDLTGAGSECNDSGENRNDLTCKEDSISMLGDNESAQILNVSSMQEKRKNKNDRGNVMNGIQSKTQDVLKCKSVEDINRFIEANKQNTKSANDINDVSENSFIDKTDDQKSDDKMEISDDKVQNSDKQRNSDDSDNKLENSDDKLETLDDRLETSDDKVDNFNDKIENSDDKLENSDDKLENLEVKLENSDDKSENSNDKTKGTDEKLQEFDDKVQDSSNIGHNSQIENSPSNDDEIQNSDKKTENVIDTVQNSENKIQDSDDKMEESEMSEEMIETLLKDESSRDSATISEDTKPLPVT